MFAKLRVVCIGGLSAHKPNYSLLTISYLLLVVTRVKECEYLCKPIRVFDTHICRVIFNICSHTLPIYNFIGSVSIFTTTLVLAHTQMAFPHLHVVWQYSLMCITLPAIARVPQQTTHHSGNILYVANNVCAVSS